MKKIYQYPELEVMRIVSTPILVGSPGEPNAVVDPTEDPIDPGTIDSRRRRKNQWEDDEDDEMQDDMQF